MAKEPIKKTVNANAPRESHPNLEEEIRHRAYELYEQRGRENGRDLDDWLRAEAETIGRDVNARAA